MIPLGGRVVGLHDSQLNKCYQSGGQTYFQEATYKNAYICLFITGYVFLSGRLETFKTPLKNTLYKPIGIYSGYRGYLILNSLWKRKMQNS